ncbi:hypothetical protein KsCSTR_13530 [Candidatus Kuenenia stuttgartiensis]|uniref:Uncharacterized protein n=1 Tax=Kuenenia stuttgartiensis TaxID=174633 RepID=A0A6G7GMY2_KUEST|nr:hypothetical protein KsCSTR_13530 [Candidatus Kuenenia stuttgartiensis]
MIRKYCKSKTFYILNPCILKHGKIKLSAAEELQHTLIMQRIRYYTYHVERKTFSIIIKFYTNFSKAGDGNRTHMTSLEG